ncbi:MAG: hypothetical protein J6A88_00380 [Oscillospiraceae bacterium]|nr:hypothetical protein [Oscillospiraceae bacterium]
MTVPFEKTFHITASAVDRFDRLKPSCVLDYMQEVAGDHSAMLGADRNMLTQKGLFWAVIRHRIQITRLPKAGEDILVKTWPMPTTRTAYPRSTIAWDAEGNECFRSISLWVLMDMKTRTMVLPGKSGVTVEGLLLGSELAVPGSVVPRTMENLQERTVRFSDLDYNGHMNNCKYLEWIADLLPSGFHKDRQVREITLSYLSEAREGETLALQWQMQEDGCMSVDAKRTGEEISANHSRVFAAQIQF